MLLVQRNEWKKKVERVVVVKKWKIQKKNMLGAQDADVS